MTATRLRFRLPALLAVLAGALAAAPAPACPFCGMQGQTLTGDVNQASMVLYGTLKNAKLDNNTGQGTTELHIEAVIKKHEILGDQKMIVLPRYVPSMEKDKLPKYLIFCDVFKGKIDPYRGVPVKDGSDMVLYLTGFLAIKDKDVPARLRYAFNYLDNADLEISNDAYKEFGNADYKEYKDLAKELPADKIAKWLEDSNTPSFRFGTYGSLLGHCGQDKHADLLKKMLDDPKKRVTSGVDGMLAGYIMLRPKEGWDYLTGIVNDPKKDFLYRYAALRSVRFFWDLRPDVLPKADLQKGIEALLGQADIADLAVEDLRQRKCWDALDQVLALAGKESHDIPIIRRAVLRFALSCEKSNAKAADYVKAMRKKDNEWVEEVDELLKLEAVSNKK